MSKELIQRQTPPEWIEVPDHLVYVGTGDLNPEGDMGAPFLKFNRGEGWISNFTGAVVCFHYALPKDSPLLAPEKHSVNLPAGLPPVPEEGLEAMGWGWDSSKHEHNGYYWTDPGGMSWSKATRHAENRIGVQPNRFYLRIPPVPTPELVPFDRLEDFGEEFPVWVHFQPGEAHLINAMRDGEIKMGGSWSQIADLVNDGDRWSTSPLTPFDEAKPFTKEAKP
jgi:hypothetical protein